jgi:hypothetical protein
MRDARGLESNVRVISQRHTRMGKAYRPRKNAAVTGDTPDSRRKIAENEMPRTPRRAWKRIKTAGIGRQKSRKTGIS